ncbi:hypothetical protein [Nocardia sp. NPDC057668]|uniref:hypothetical protein n=1 Tax=Nocardia sp. NPDC057668 TaxID=3346202 RepID=UPI003672176E
MHGWRDLFTHDLVLSETFTTTAVVGLRGDTVDGLFEVDSEIVDLDGSHPTAENAATARVNNVIDAAIGFDYTETAMETKAEMKVYLKEYFGRILRHLKDAGATPDQVERFESDAVKIITHLNSMYPRLQFYLFRSMDTEAGRAFAYYRGENRTPTFMYITHGLTPA